MIEEKNTKSTKMEQEAFEIPTVIRAQKHSIEVVVDKIVDAILVNQINGVVLCGRGSSNNACVFAKYLIESRIGIVASLCSPSVNSIYGASQDLNNKIFLVISQSGRSLDLIASAADAKKRGAIVVALVNDSGSPLAISSDFFIPLGAGTETSVAATKTFVASLSAILQLVSKWSSEGPLEKSLDILPEYLNSCLSVDWSEAVSILINERHTYVLGRGYSLAVAQEVALKLKETSHILAEAYSFAEFMHGPVTTISEGHRLLVFAQQDETIEGSSNSIEKLNRLGASILSASTVVFDGCTRLTLPQAPHPLIESLGMITAFYPLAAKLAVARGINPDEPPHISKVTLTL